MTSPPRLSVVMTTYNSGHYLKPAVESVLNQTFNDFEFIIVDDCSTEDDLTYLRTLDDPRLRLVCNSQNLGQTISLNTAITCSRGVYLARMDADDVCLANRFIRQINYLEENPQIDLVGTQAYLIDEQGRRFGQTQLPTTPDSIWAYSLLQCPFVHPAVMMRSNLFKERGYSYSSEFINQDFELWSRLLDSCQGANLKEPLLCYRVHTQSMTYRHFENNIQSTREIIMRRLQRENLQQLLTHCEVELLVRYFFAGRSLADRDKIDRVQLGNLMWQAAQVISRRRPATSEYLMLSAYRIFQVALWPNGTEKLRQRLCLFLQIFIATPITFMRTGWCVLNRLIQRLIRKMQEKLR